MVEEGNASPVKNSATPELSPQDDGTKAPLTNNDEPNARVEEAKFKKGDAQIDVGIPPTFSGLTKEELMKYANDPFWIRLRMFLFILFWAAWIAMLVLAIVIIVKAPACKPPPERLWVEEHAMIDIDSANLPDIAELESIMETLGVSSAYFPDLISDTDLKEPKYDALPLIESLLKKQKKVVTDLPAFISKSNPVYGNASESNFIIDGSDSGEWNYDTEGLADAMMKYFLDFWISKGVTGFLMQNTDSEGKMKFKNNLNEVFKDQGGALGSDIIDFDSKQREFTPSNFQDFLEDTSDKWSFFKFNPKVAEGSVMTAADMRLATVGLFLYRGTPILTNYNNLDNSTYALINQLSSMRSLNGIKVGKIHFVNQTESDSVVAYTRVHKGTPAYAVALNFNSINETMSFNGTANLGGNEGTVEIDSKPDDTMYQVKIKKDLRNIFLEPYEGMVIQFVADF